MIHMLAGKMRATLTSRMFLPLEGAYLLRKQVQTQSVD